MPRNNILQTRFCMKLTGRSSSESEDNLRVCVSYFRALSDSNMMFNIIWESESSCLVWLKEHQKVLILHLIWERWRKALSEDSITQRAIQFTYFVCNYEFPAKTGFLDGSVAEVASKSLLAMTYRHSLILVNGKCTRILLFRRFATLSSWGAVVRAT